MTAELLDGLFAMSDNDDEPEERVDLNSERAKPLRDAVMGALQQMCKAGHIEILDENMDLVADELSYAWFDARNPRHALKKLRKACVNSESVEEVYADDRTIEKIFRRALGG